MAWRRSGTGRLLATQLALYHIDSCLECEDRPGFHSARIDHRRES